jgi:hypothetical protein
VGGSKKDNEAVKRIAARISSIALWPLGTLAANVTRMNRKTMRWPSGTVADDADKIARYLNLRRSYGNGYLLVYSEAKGPNKQSVLKRRMNRILAAIRENGWKLAGKTVRTPRTGAGWGWALSLFKYGRTRASN